MARITDCPEEFIDKIYEGGTVLFFFSDFIQGKMMPRSVESKDV